MSLSSLQAQLAALKDGGRTDTVTTGTTFASSRRHGDAVGRGLSYSVQQGHQVALKGSSTKYKASLIYATAAAASDIPLSTLEQLFREAFTNEPILRDLSWNGNEETIESILLSNNSVDRLGDDHDTTGTSSPFHDNRQEENQRNNHTNNKTTTRVAIQQTLLAIASVLAECDASTNAESLSTTSSSLSSVTSPRLTACLNVLEYMLRKFHLHEILAVDLLWTLLPVAETFPLLVHRYLKLVDWTSVASSQSYLWLRPYCLESIPTSTPTESKMQPKRKKHKASASNVVLPLVPSRAVIASNVIKHGDILRTVCIMSHQLAKLHQRETTMIDSNRRSRAVRHGIAYLLSYTAALLVEGLNSSLRAKHAAIYDKEAIVRTLLPAVVLSLDHGDAASGDCRAWGMVVVSSLAETMTLSTRTTSLLCTKLVGSIQNGTVARNEDDYMDEEGDEDQLETGADAMACILSILLPQRQDGAYNAAPEFATCYLPLLNQRCLGCPLTPSVFTALLSLDHVLPSLLGHLYNERNMVVAPLLGALISMAIQDRSKLQSSTVDLIGGLIKCDQLRGMWNDPRTDLVASVAAFVLDSLVPITTTDDVGIMSAQEKMEENALEDTENDSDLFSACTILKMLHQHSPDTAERGVASALESFSTRHQNTTPLHSQQHWQFVRESRRIAFLLQSICLDHSFPPIDNRHVTTGSQATPAPIETLLPPRVALEHVNADIRLRAVQHLLETTTSSYSSIDNTLLECLFRHIVDPDIDVATNACRALVAWFVKGMVQPTHNMMLVFAPTALSAAYEYWRADKPEQTESFRASLALLAYLSREGARSGNVHLLIFWQRSIELLAAVVAHDDETMAHHAAELILVAFEHRMESLTGDIVSTASDLMLRNKPFINGLLRISDESTADKFREVNDCVVRRKCVTVLVSALNGSFQRSSTKRKKNSNDTAIHATKLCQLVIELSNDPTVMPDLTDEECGIVKSCLKYCTPSLCQASEQIPDILVALASTESKQLWVSVSIPTIFSILEHCRDRRGKMVSAYTVLFEAAFRPGNSDTSVKHFLSIARKVARNEKCKAVWLSVLPALGLLEHSNQEVRALAANLLAEVGPRMPASMQPNMTSDWSSLSDLCERISNFKSSAKIGGASFLSSFLALSIGKSSNAKSLSNALLTLSVYSALSIGRDEEVVMVSPRDDGWLTREGIVGGCEIASRLLSAMESAGEDSFPLLRRWNLAGRVLSSTFLSETETAGSSSENLANCVVRMLKGTTLTDPSIVISSGPRQGIGGRSRSYSIGKMDGVSFISPYPSDMTDTLINVFVKYNVISGSKILVTLAAQAIIQSKAWGEFVFKNLSHDSRIKLVQGVLLYAQSDNSQHSEALFAELPLDATDIIGLFSNDVDDVNHEAMLVDFVFLNCDSFLSRSDAPALVDFLFHRLGLYSKKSETDDGSTAVFVIQSVSLALDKLLVPSLGVRPTRQMDDATLQSWIETMLLLISSRRSARIKHARTRTALLSILAELSSKFPDRVVASLVPAISSSMESSGEDNYPLLRVATRTFISLVPVYVKYASTANQSLTKLLSAFLASMSTVPTIYKERMLDAFAESFVTDRDTSSKYDRVDLCIGAFQAFFIASEVHHRSGTDLSSDSIGIAVGFIGSCLPHQQMKSLQLILSYANGLLSLLNDGNVDVMVDGEIGFLPTPLEIGTIAATGSLAVLDGNTKAFLSSASATKSVRITIQGLLRVFSDGIVFGSIRRFIGQDETEAAGMSLRLWQDLLLIQSTAQSSCGVDDESSFQESILNLANESRDFLQSILPPHVFFASVSALIGEVEAAGTRSMALRLIADRATTTAPGSPEVSLLVDTIPPILAVLKTATLSVLKSQEEFVMVQSALVSIEHIARSFQISSGTPIFEASKQTASTYFVEALRCCFQLLLACSRQQQMDVSSVSDLVSSTSLCCTSLLRVVGSASISILPKLMKALVKLLGSLNATFSLKSATATDNVLLIANKIAQLSILRALTTVIESTPQFITPYLPVLLTKSAILSENLRQVEEDKIVPLQQAVEHLFTTLAAQVAPRLLIPVASAALIKSTGSNEILLLLSVLRSSAALSSSSITVAHKTSLLNAVITSFEWKGTWEERNPLVSSACALFDTMILKLSEIQLRRVYTSLREWRGDMDPTAPEDLATRRYAFWLASARLSKELRSIFFPCLGAVLDDMIAELNLAAASFDRQPKSSTETKKRKIDHASFGKESMRALQPILSTLESALRADALQGGSWIRSDESRKYEAILEPLGKLLLCRIPADFPTPGREDNAYNYFAQGTTDGSVVGCLTALATAGGNEQLWKPLNHAILQACSEEKRSEVRRAGLSCMLNLLKSLGEEYMVLLPENLPLLSELLEDTNEEVACLAKEIVTMAEELLGESLEDSLR